MKCFLVQIPCHRKADINDTFNSQEHK
jgi:hypothetical protein